MFTRAWHWSLSWARWIQSTLFHSVSLRVISILLYCVVFGVLSSSHIFWLKLFMHFSSPMHDTCPMHLILLDVILPNTVWWRVQVMKLLIMQSSPSFWHIFLFRSKYSLQHSVLKRSQNFTPMVYMSLGCRWRSWPTDMEGSFECIE